MAEGIRIGGGGKNYGANVWERGILTPSVTRKFTFSYIEYVRKTIRIQLTTEGIDISEVTPEMLIGKLICTYSTSKVYFDSTDTVLYKYANGEENFSYSFDNTTGIITVYGDPIFRQEFGWEYQSNVETIPEKWTLQDYIVNDDSSAYPNEDYGKGGYYYKLLAQVTSANVASLSDTTLMTVQQDYRDQIETEVSNANS